MEGFDQLCRVTGTVDGERFEGRGQRGRSWGAPDWERMLLARTLWRWFDDDHAITAVAVRPADGESHADEASRRSSRAETRRRRRGRRRRGSRRPTTPRSASAPPAWSSTSARTTSSPPGPRERSSPARRWTSGACAWTARSSAGGCTAAPASGATTSCAAFRDRGHRQRLGRRAHLAPDGLLRALSAAGRHPARRARRGHGADHRAPRREPAVRARARRGVRGRVPLRAGHRDRGRPGPRRADGDVRRALLRLAGGQPAADRLAGRGAGRARCPPGAADQQRPRVGAALARDVRRRPVRAGRRLLGGRPAQARPAHLRADPGAPRATGAGLRVPRRPRAQLRGGGRAGPARRRFTDTEQAIAELGAPLQLSPPSRSQR